jgi:hypothetical protein
MIKQRPTIQEWLELPTEQRNILVLRFAINKSGGVQVRNNRVVSDGVSDKDLDNGVNIGKMIDYLGDPEWKKYIDVPLEDLADTLWAACVAKEFNLPSPFEVDEQEPEKATKKATKKASKKLDLKKADEKEIELPVEEEESGISV